MTSCLSSPIDQQGAEEEDNFELNEFGLSAFESRAKDDTTVPLQQGVSVRYMRCKAN